MNILNVILIMHKENINLGKIRSKTFYEFNDQLLNLVIENFKIP